MKVSDVSNEAVSVETKRPKKKCLNRSGGRSETSPLRLDTFWWTCATQTGLLALAVGVRVGRRGRRGDGPIAVLLRAVLISPGDGVVGGGSVLKKRFAVHHLSRPNTSSSCPGLCPQLNKLDNNKKGQYRSPTACLVLPRSRATLADAQRRQKQRKQRNDAAPKWNFVPLHAPTLPPSAQQPQIFTKGPLRKREWVESAR